MAYVAPLINRIDGLLAKDEGASYGTDAAPVAANDGIRISDRIWQRARFYYLNDNLRDNAATGTMIPLPPAAGAGLVAEIDVGWEARGRGSAYAAGAGNAIEPGAHALHGACGWPGTFNAGPVTYTYAPIPSGARASSTVYP